MTGEVILDSHSGVIFLICLFYGIHMVEEFSFGFVPWADRYFGRFDWKQNLIGNFIFLVCVAAACYLYYDESDEIPVGWHVCGHVDSCQCVPAYFEYDSGP